MPKTFPCFACIRESRGALRDASVELRNDREVVMAALEENGLTLRYASADLKDDEELATGTTFGSTG